MSQSAPMTIFMLVKTTPEWLAIAPDGRFAFLESTMRPLLKQHPTVTFRFYDTEFYSARVTDVLVWEVTDRHAYELVIEGLRETPFWDRYFQIVDILPSVENAYADNYGRETLNAA